MTRSTTERFGRILGVRGSFCFGGRAVFGLG
jgi:hypothetical protein